MKQAAFSFSILKMEVRYSFETSIDFQWITSWIISEKVELASEY
jgi:hypothetical protein